MKHVKHINGLIHEITCKQEPLVFFGQNISAGSCIGGLASGLQPTGKRMVLNTPNMENTLVGTGFGLMMSGVNSILFMKQQDFLLLGIDQLVNTHNLLRQRQGLGSFTILQVVVDSGFEGPQASLNNLPDICSIGRISGFAISNAHDSQAILRKYLVRPGFRIISLSQRLMQANLMTWLGNTVTVSDDAAVYQYTEGQDATVVTFNFAFEQGVELIGTMQKCGYKPAFFSVASSHPVDWTPILESVNRTKCIVILDDAKSVNRVSHQLALAARDVCANEKVVLVPRLISDRNLRPNLDQFEIESGLIFQRLGLPPRAVAFGG